MNVQIASAAVTVMFAVIACAPGTRPIRLQVRMKKNSVRKYGR